jgi:hypothetical protein
MAYQPRIRSPRRSGQGYRTLRHEKAKAKRQKHRSIRNSTLQENHVATAEEVVDGTLKRLVNLGSQIFASSPYSEHFNRWIRNLKDVLSEFESNPTISSDDQFIKERSEILSNVELNLEERRRKEASLEESIQNLSDNKILLEQIEKEYVTTGREIQRRKNNEIKRLYGIIDNLRGELDTIVKMKTGIFRGMSKKIKAQKETEASQRLNTAQKELELTLLNFTAERERLRDEHEKRKQPIVENIRHQQKHIENLEVDASLEDRKTACDALVNAINALFQRKTQKLHLTPQ